MLVTCDPVPRLSSIAKEEVEPHDASSVTVSFVEEIPKVNEFAAPLANTFAPGAKLSVRNHVFPLAALPKSSIQKTSVGAHASAPIL